MNKAAKIVSDSIIGNDFKTVIVAGKPYTIYPPTIHKMAGGLSCLAVIDMKEGATIKDILVSMKDMDKYSEALSWFIHDDDSLKKELNEGTFEEGDRCVGDMYRVHFSAGFSESCHFDEERSKDGSKTKVIGNQTLLGQIASFMEYLHLGYHDVLYEIPYRNLLIMQKDKLHEVFGEVVNRTTGKNLANRRKNK